MDLQAILDASSSDEDDDYLQKYTSSYGEGIIGGSSNAAVSSDNDGVEYALSSDTMSNLSNVSSPPQNVGGASDGMVDVHQQKTQQALRAQQIMDEYDQLLAGLDQSREEINAMNSADILRDLDGGNNQNTAEVYDDENDIVGQILKSYGNKSNANNNSGASANLELEKILREADANDDDDDTDEDHGGYQFNKSPARSIKSRSSGKPNYQTASSSDILLQSILNEADDSNDDDDEHSDPLSPSSGGYLNTSVSKSQYNVETSFSGLSLSGKNSTVESFGEMRRLSSLTQPQQYTSPTAATAHSMEVDAILNSVADDDDSDDKEMRNYSTKQPPSQQRSHYGGMSTAIFTDSDDTDENDGGLNFNFSSTKTGSAVRPLQDAKYDDNISMQYPLTRKESGLPSGHEQKDIYIHHDQQDVIDTDYSLKDYTANFLHKHVKHQDGAGGSNAHESFEIANPDGTTSSSKVMDDEQQFNRLTALALKYAENYEHRLLKPNTRNVVSPLNVKRRMKPKVELMTKSRMTSGGQSSSTATPAKQFDTKQSQQQPRFGFSGGIIQSKSMTTLGSQLLNKRRTQSSSGGLPTSLAVNSKFIAVGNQTGQVWVFDLFEQLKIILGDNNSSTRGTSGSTNIDADVSSAGSVTSIDLSLHGDFLLAGYGCGHIILWDIIKGSVLKRITDLHTSSISSARLTSVPMSLGGSSSDNEIGAVSVDAGGLVNKLVFTRGRLWSSTYSYETECLLDGTAGQILAMDALPSFDMAQNMDPLDGMDYHPSIHKIVLIALSSGRSSFAVSVEPKVSVLHRWARPSTEQIDPTINDEDRLTQVSSVYASSYASSYAGASSYVSTSTYLSNSTVEVTPPKKPSDATPVPYLPCLSWGWALVSGGGHSVTPILARAWGCCLQFLRASFPPRDENDDDADNTIIHWPAFGSHDEFDAAAPVVALNWLGKRSLVYLTLTNEFTIIDTVIMTMQERLDFSGMSLVYAEFALSRSRQLPDSNSRTTFMNSIRSSDNRLLVLCQEEIKEITVLGMRQQIMSLEDGGQWLEALALALDHYESTIKSQEDNQRDAARHLDSVMMASSPDPSLLTEDEIWMAELLMRYLILAIDNAPESISFSSNDVPSSRLNLAESHFEMLSGVCLEFCVVTRRLDLLFGPIFRCFYEARYIKVFLSVMETYILNDKLKYIAPEAMVLFVAHCKDMNDLSMVERCLLHMDCTLMDFDSILSLLKKNALYTGLIHVYSSGLDDYISPLEILFEAVFDSVDAGDYDIVAGLRKDGIPRNKMEQYGYKALLYLQYCFRGKTFPKGKDILPEERMETLRPELFELLFRETKNSPQQRSHPNSTSASRGIRGSSYPYLRALILVDPKAFLDCLSIVFDDPDASFKDIPIQMTWEVEFETDEMVQQIFSPEQIDPRLLPDKQSLVDIMSSLIMDDSTTDTLYHIGSREHISTKGKKCFLDFLAKYLKLGVVTAPMHLISEVFVRVCNKSGASEDEILALLHALPRSSYELDKILTIVERAQMTRGALFLHQVGVSKSIDQEGMMKKCQHHFNRSIDCYLRDDDEGFRKGVFAYTRRECSGRNISVLRNVVLSRLPELVQLDAVHTAHLIGEIFVEDIDMILSSLKDVDSGRVEYSFLHAIISGELEKVDTVAAQELSANLTADHHHSYLLLMTKFDPDIVYQYLSSNVNYRLNDALKLCQDCNITDASAYLLERSGDVSGALKLMLDSLDKQMLTLKTILDSCSTSHKFRRGAHSVPLESRENDAAQKEISRIKQILSAVLDLCERNKNDHLALDNERGPLLWFHVLDRLVNAKSLLRISKDSSAQLSTVLSELLLLTMQRMISNVPLYELMQKITKDHAGSDLGEFREMLVSMLKTYSSELDVCSSAVDVMYTDIRHMSYEKKRLKVQGSFVQECPSHVSKSSILDVGPGGSYEVSNQRYTSCYSFSKKQSSANGSVSLLQQRRRSQRNQSRVFGRGSRRAGKGINLMTASEYHVGVDAHDMFGMRQVGMLSEAQHVGGL